jgi:two-component system, NtrC family, sensor kinase
MATANAVLISDLDTDLATHGIDCVPWKGARDYLKTANPSVLGVLINPKLLLQGTELMRLERQRNHKKHFIILYQDLQPTQIAELFQQLAPIRFYPYGPKLQLADLFAQCFDLYFAQEQKEKLVELIQEKNDQLKQLTIKLEKKVNERQEQLEQSIHKNVLAKKQLEALNKALVQIYQSTSVPEIEQSLTHVLKKEFDITWVSIRDPAQSNQARQKADFKIYQVPLKEGSKSFGQLIFYKDKDKKFGSKEKRFLTQVGDAVTLSLKRNDQYLRSQEMKRQWEATFDAISDPICLTDADYNILRINSSFLQRTQSQDYRDHIGHKCYTALFGRQSPCEGCQRGQTFQIRNPSQQKSSEVFEVYSNDLGVRDQSVYFQMYKDVTQDLNLQRQVIESAKMAELGTISSSIAHELNNPIGGMLNFVQLMKMDLNGQEDFYPDLLEIEKGIIKCKDIVKSLLGFSRKSFQSDIQSISLNEVIEQAIRITELKTRSIGIRILFNAPDNDITIQGRFNLLTHAIRNIMQNAQESLIEVRRADKTFKGVIEISLTESPSHVELLVCDNGKGLEPGIKDKIFDPLFTTKDPETNSGLGLTLAQQIVKEHGGHISVSTSKDKNLCFKILFSKPQGQSG